MSPTRDPRRVSMYHGSARRLPNDLAGVLFLTEFRDDALHNCWFGNVTSVAILHQFEVDLSSCFCCESIPSDLEFASACAASLLRQLREHEVAPDISDIWVPMLGHPVFPMDPPEKQARDRAERDRRRLEIAASLSAHGYDGLYTGRMRSNRHQGRVLMTFAASTLKRVGEEACAKSWHHDGFRGFDIQLNLADRRLVEAGLPQGLHAASR